MSDTERRLFGIVLLMTIFIWLNIIRVISEWRQWRWGKTTAIAAVGVFSLVYLVAEVMPQVHPPP